SGASRTRPPSTTHDARRPPARGARRGFQPRAARGARSGSRTRPAFAAGARSWLLHLSREAFELANRQHLLVHHADQKLLDRAGAESVDDVPHGARGHPSRPHLGAVHEHFSLAAVAEVASRLEAAE